VSVSEHSAAADNSGAGDARRGLEAAPRSYLEAVRAADVAGAYRIASRVLAGGLSLAALYQRVVAPAMHELGRLWEEGVITIADEHMATALTHRVLGALRAPSFAKAVFEPDSDRPRAMLAAVQGEQHALALRMAADLLEDAGYQALYLGANVPTAALLEAIELLSPGLLALSATMPDSVRILERVLAEIGEEHPRLGLVIGGQAIASRSSWEAMPVENLEELEDRVRSL
jgi:MerR family transcriptional regulator, light-induced transcriptional regulator